ncbi:hypothetical protein APHAL10511_006014 [Amanita phalloides]|nr:hypothetical protein APHAL10511_006014 [Amanita phalloides]
MTSAPPLAKYLASTDKKTRDKTIQQLSAFLSSDSSHDVLSKSDLAKLWKGIFYCFWMSDKPLVRQALASELAELLLSASSTSTSLTFLGGFWETTVREWNGIDRLRIDKYYMLVRRFVNATFRLLIRAKWDSTACESYNSILMIRGGPLCPSDMRVPTSLSCHLADIYLEELEKALSSSPSAPPAPLVTILEPFFSLAARTQNKIVYQRIQSEVLDPLLSALSNQVDSGDERRACIGESDLSALISNACLERSEHRVVPAELKNKLICALLKMSDSPDARDANKRRLHALCRELDGNGV